MVGTRIERKQKWVGNGWTKDGETECNLDDTHDARFDRLGIDKVFGFQTVG